MGNVTNKATTVKRARETTCRCDAYRFPHREGGGKCLPPEERDYDPSCADCMGTGIGWGGPDSSCSSCRGSGIERARRERDDY